MINTEQTKEQTKEQEYKNQLREKKTELRNLVLSLELRRSDRQHKHKEDDQASLRTQSERAKEFTKNREDLKEKARLAYEKEVKAIQEDYESRLELLKEDRVKALSGPEKRKNSAYKAATDAFQKAMEAPWDEHKKNIMRSAEQLAEDLHALAREEEKEVPALKREIEKLALLAYPPEPKEPVLEVTPQATEGATTVEMHA